jgi:hypothetical protein
MVVPGTAFIGFSRKRSRVLAFQVILDFFIAAE